MHTLTLHAKKLIVLVDEIDTWYELQRPKHRRPESISSGWDNGPSSNCLRSSFWGRKEGRVYHWPDDLSPTYGAFINCVTKDYKISWIQFSYGFVVNISQHPSIIYCKCQVNLANQVLKTENDYNLYSAFHGFGQD